MKAIEWISGKVRIIDQTKLPNEEIYLDLTDYKEVASAIKNMLIRGAPAIGLAAAYGVALGAQQIKASSLKEFLTELGKISNEMAITRPTARNLFWALERMNKIAFNGTDISQVKKDLIKEAITIAIEGEQANRRMGQYGTELIQDGFTILTHCNAGSLATEGYGTALGVIRAAKEQGKKIQVYADETRPFLQGARLTAWELIKEHIPVILITDNMAGHFLKKGQINCVIVGADRIAANGDVANKIGTYSVAVLAHENKVPFYVAAPLSTIDLSIDSGEDIVIEERNAEEVTNFGGICIAPAGVKVSNPAFDVTPNKYISAIITERGIIRKPYKRNLVDIIKGEK